MRRAAELGFAGMTVRVAADTYAENVIITQSVDLKGAQAGQNANTRFAAFTGGPSDPKADPTVETVLTTPTDNPTGGNPNANDLIRVVANNITIDGLVIDGNNPALGPSTVQVGTINIDIVDAEKKQMIWEAVSEGRVSDEMMANPKVAVNGVVTELMRQYPGRPNM